MITQFVSHSQEQTHHLGASLAKHLFPGAFVALWGALGAGKTAFARGVGEGMGAMDVRSPTFTIVQAHEEAALPLYHFDVYRLRSGDELYDIGFDEYEHAKGVILMEWPENVLDALPTERMDILIEGSGEMPRLFRFQAHGPRHSALLAQWEEED